MTETSRAELDFKEFIRHKYIIAHAISKIDRSIKNHRDIDVVILKPDPDYPLTYPGYVGISCLRRSPVVSVLITCSDASLFEPPFTELIAQLALHLKAQLMN